MQLIYKIEFKSTSSYYKHIIEDLISQAKIKASCKQYRDFIIIKIDDNEEKIESFFDLLSKELPLSIYLGNSSVIESLPQDIQELEEHNVMLNMALLTNKNIHDILINNSIDFSNDILKILKGGVSRFETHNGLKDFFLPNKELRVDFENRGFEVKLLVTNPSKLEEIFDINIQDFKLLCSIERPLVKLKFKILKNANKEFSSTNFVYAKLPDDKETLLFANALKNSAVDFVLYVNDETYQDGIKVTYFKEQNLIIKGDKALFPKYDFIANKKFNSSKEYFEENGGVYKAVLAQNHKRLTPSVGVYFSLASKDSFIGLNIPTKGEKKVIVIPNIHNSIKNCFEEISQIDEHCARLIGNFSKKYPNVLIGDVPQNTDGFESIVNMCAKVLEINSAKEFEDMALGLTLSSGMQIDMKLVNLNGLNYLDYRRTVQSMMSYKMAGVDNATLVYSFYESLSEFICNYANEIATEIKAKDIVLCGDMFANSILLSKTNKTLSKNYNIILPKEYPLDF